MRHGRMAMSWNLNNSTTWAIDSDSVNEIGCIHTAQGLEFDYVGVIIGKDLTILICFCICLKNWI